MNPEAEDRGLKFILPTMRGGGRRESREGKEGRRRVSPLPTIGNWIKKLKKLDSLTARTSPCEFFCIISTEEFTEFGGEDSSSESD
jgi:hypothetical protein